MTNRRTGGRSNDVAAICNSQLVEIKPLLQIHRAPHHPNSGYPGITRVGLFNYVVRQTP
ncbi:MAG: hypothetical protein AAGF95_22685 [Chloroflexota bacterium]